MDKGVLTISGFTIAVIAVILAIALSGEQKAKNTPPRDLCIQHSGVAMHIHPELTIELEGQKVAIPANIGITSSCMKAVHTHDEAGTLHIEYPEERDFVLGDFFAVWGQPFSQNEIMDKKVDEQHTITMTVDGEPNTDFENLVLKDQQQIVIRYHTK